MRKSSLVPKLQHLRHTCGLKLWHFKEIGPVDVPYWDVAVDRLIIKNHGDIWNDKARYDGGNFPNELPVQNGRATAEESACECGTDGRRATHVGGSTGGKARPAPRARLSASAAARVSVT